MMSRAKLLAQRRTMLITECALQRITLRGQAQARRGIAEWIRTSANLVYRLKSLPGWASALLVGLVVFLPGRAVRLAKNGIMIWQVWRAFSSGKRQLP